CGRPECVPCANGRQDFCTTGAYRERGIMREHGFMTERVVDDARFMVPLPAALHDVGVLVEPLTIAEKALLEARRMMDRMPWRGDGVTNLHAVVLGGGPVGLLGAMALRAAGCRVSLISKQGDDDVRANLLRAIGGKYVSAASDSLTTLLGRLG